MKRGGACSWREEHQSGACMESVFVMGTDYSRERRADRVTPKKHRKGQEVEYVCNRNQGKITGHGLRL